MAEPFNICRVCLKQGTYMMSLFEFEDTKQYCHKIMHCAGVNISKFDDYPKSICKECQEELETAYNFVIKCQTSDKNLQGASVVNKQITTGIVDVSQEIKNENEDCIDDIYDGLDYTENSFDVKNSLDFYTGAESSKIHKSKKKKFREKNRKLKTKREKRDKKECICVTCGINVASRAAMIIHMRKHTGEKPYKCPVCDMHFSQTGTLKVHIQRRHSSEPRHLRERPFACEFCGGRFFSKRDLTAHSRRHTGDHPYSCEVCSQRFTQVGSLIRHRRIHTGERPYQCKLCPKAFIDGNMLRKHQLVHTTERLFTCNICGRAVKSKYGLDKHMTLHQERKPVICDKCGATSSSKGNLTAHIKKHHSEKSGQCQVCGKNCPDLTEHMRKHTGEKAYTCNICGKGFPLKISLAVHMHKHTRADKFKCEKEDCNKTFTRKNGLDLHLIKVHAYKLNFENVLNIN